MTDSLRHRGPDADGHYFWPTAGAARNATVTKTSAPTSVSGVALGHRRLSIIDVTGSAQPLGNEDNTVQITFNGEIYNYVELRRELINAGHQFRTDGDTEVIVHLYEQHGLNFVKHLRGMFALAIWDANRQRLVIARDRAGKKPFYYRMEDGRLAFASELKALLQIPEVPRTLNRMAVLQFL